MPIMSLGISDAVFRYTLDKTVDRRKVLTTGFFVNIACAAVILAVYPLLGSIAYFDGYMWLIILYTFVANIHSLFAQYVRARGMTTLFAVQGILATAITVTLNILFLVVFRFGVTGYVLSIVIADAAMALFMTAVVRLDYAIRPRFFDRVLTKRMLRYCVPLMPTTVFWWVTNVSDRYMIKGMIGDDVNGIYSAAFRIPTMLILLSGIFIEAWQFSAVSERDESTKRAHAAFFGKVFDSYQGLLFISGAGLIAFSKIFSRILFAEDYYTAWMYMPVLIIATVYSGLVTFMGSVYLVDKKSVQSLVTSMIGAGINVILNLILIPTKLGAIGAAIATFFSYFVVFIIRAKDTRHLIRFPLHTRKLAVNTIILSVQAVTMMSDAPGWILTQVLGIMIIFALNASPIIAGVMKLLKRL